MPHDGQAEARAAQLAGGATPSNGTATAQKTSAGILALPFGRLIVGVIAAGIAVEAPTRPAAAPAGRNPGVDSLKAALNPAPVNYLYFVSKNDGSHFFSASLVEHNKAINRYKYIKNQQIQQLKNKSDDEED